MIRKTLLVISLVLFAGTVWLWVWSYLARVVIRTDILGLYAHFGVVALWTGSTRVIQLPVALLAILFAGSTVLLVRSTRRLRDEYRRRHNLCLTCGYDLTGNVSGRCSECGAPVETDEKARTECSGSG